MNKNNIELDTSSFESYFEQYLNNSLENKIENDIYLKKYVILSKYLDETKKSKFYFFNFVCFLAKYSLTTAIIFAVLLVTTNFQAYKNIAMSYLQKKEMQEVNNSIINSVKAIEIISESEEEEEVNKPKNIINLDYSTTKKKYVKDSISSFTNIKSEKVSLDINITPYENRVIIPKIGKNIPLIEIKDGLIKKEEELDNIFMSELENGVIRYPGSVKPGEAGSSFIFGHSSNFPWVKGDYNQVFALLNELTKGDEIIIYFEQKKYIYKVTKKEVVTPTNIDIFKNEKEKDQVMLMTCWPIGTTLNRLIVTGEITQEG